jgi:hypothetical protein
VEPLQISAVAVQWEFRCGRDGPTETPWAWRCRSVEGIVIAESRESYRTLREALEDALRSGFESALSRKEDR